MFVGILLSVSWFKVTKYQLIDLSFKALKFDFNSINGFCINWIKTKILKWNVAVLCCRILKYICWVTEFLEIFENKIKLMITLNGTFQINKKIIFNSDNIHH